MGSGQHESRVIVLEVIEGPVEFVDTHNNQCNCGTPTTSNNQSTQVGPSFSVAAHRVAGGNSHA